MLLIYELLSLPTSKTRGKLTVCPANLFFGPKYAVTARVVSVQVEDDGDLHVVMENTDGRRGRIVVELPVGRPWCKLRTAVFAWTNARFTLLPRDRDTMHVTRHPIVTVIGRAFYDVDHASRNPRTNRRDYDRRLAVWEIHPVMILIQSVGAVF